MSDGVAEHSQNRSGNQVIDGQVNRNHNRQGLLETVVEAYFHKSQIHPGALRVAGRDEVKGLHDILHSLLRNPEVRHLGRNFGFGHVPASVRIPELVRILDRGRSLGFHMHSDLKLGSDVHVAWGR